jgi:MoxR-like ATPase
VRPVLSGAELLELRGLARQVLCGEHLLRLVAELVAVTNPRSPDADERTRRLVRYGASPRAGQAIILAAKVRSLLDQRASVSREDIRAPMLAALRHRVVLSFEADAEGVGVENLLDGWFEAAAKRAGL